MTNSTRQTLTSVLPKLRKRIQKIHNRNENIGEQNTKAALIDPLLAALGWDVEDIDEVSREYRRKSQDNPVDYALLMLRSPQLFVEAKGLAKDLSPPAIPPSLTENGHCAPGKLAHANGFLRNGTCYTIHRCAGAGCGC